MKNILLICCISLLLATFCGCSNEPKARKVSRDITNISTTTESTTKSKTTNTTTVNNKISRESTTEFSTSEKENVENKVEISTTKPSNEFKSKNKNTPTKSQEKSTLAFFDED